MVQVQEWLEKILEKQKIQKGIKNYYMNELEGRGANFKNSN